MTILIADDDDIIRLLLSSALTKLGHDVREAANGRDAWDAWQGGGYSFIISDWMMPDLDGLEFCRRIRAQPRDAYTYIVLLTARTGRAHYLEAMSAGADDVSTKPFEHDSFAARMRVGERILGLHESMRAANTGLDRRLRAQGAELRAARATREDFLSQASHELLAPMTDILGFSQLLQMESLTDDQAASVRQIRSSGRHLLKLIDRMLEPAQVPPRDGCFLDAAGAARPFSPFDSAV